MMTMERISSILAYCSPNLGEQEQEQEQEQKDISTHLKSTITALCMAPVSASEREKST